MKPIDTDRYPINQPGEPAYADMLASCRSSLQADGMFTLPGFMRPSRAAEVTTALTPRFEGEGFRHAREHNIYFRDQVEGVSPDDPSLKKVETVNTTLCADQLADTLLATLYHSAAFRWFLMLALDLPALYPMADPLAAFNAMRYGNGEALNWHFDRSEFTTTLLLQEPAQGGVFEYRPGLRDGGWTDHAGVARLVAGEDDGVQQVAMAAGALNVFRGRDTAHRVTPVNGGRPRMIAVFSYFDRPGVRFSDAEQKGFYGRTA